VIDHRLGPRILTPRERPVQRRGGSASSARVASKPLGD
jgi:hypothetical protein